MSAILFDIGHPAHVHLFKNFILYLKSKSHHVVVVSREKDVASALLDGLGIEAVSLSRAGRGSLGFAAELAKRDTGIFRLHRRHRFDLALGTSVSIAHLSALTRVRSYVFEQDDDDVVPLFARLTYPFATGIVVPSCLKFRKWAKKRVVHNSYHELAYLHPDHFSPDPRVPEKYGVEPGAYIILRHSALKAHHDAAQKGLEGGTLEKIRGLIRGYPVLSSREGDPDRSIEPWDMHHLLAFAKMLIADSQTMTREAAILGVPSLRYSSFVGRISVIEELEHRYGLTFGFRPGQEEGLLGKIEEWLAASSLGEQWQAKRRRLLAEKSNFVDWMIAFFRPFL